MYGNRKWPTAAVSGFQLHFWQICLGTMFAGGFENTSPVKDIVKVTLFIFIFIVIFIVIFIFVG